MLKSKPIWVMGRLGARRHENGNGGTEFGNAGKSRMRWL
jgi:hypothetical protein